MIIKGVLTKTIPTILGILLLAGGIAGGFFLVKNQQLVTFKGGPQTLPQGVTFTNLTANSFTVFWITEEATSGFLHYGEDEKKLSQIVADYRDKLSGETKNYLTHYVNVEGLNPQKKYYFKIGSGGKNSLYDDSGRPYELTTGPTLGTQPSNDIVYGKVVGADQKPASGAIVYLNLPGGSPLSALTGKDGMWAKTLQTMRTADLGSYLSYNAETSVLNLKATNGLKNEQNATISLLAKNDKPVPTIVLGKNQNYQETQAKAEDSALAQSKKSSDFSSLVDLENLASANQQTVTITNPGQEGEQLNTGKPQFFGMGPSRKTLTVEIQSPKKYTGTVVVDDEGRWQYTPPENLTPGVHLLTVGFLDENGREQKLTRNFTVLAQGLEAYPAFEASPSASATPSATPEPRVTLPSTQSGVPKSGTVTPTFLVFLAGLTFLLVGVFWQWRNQKQFIN